jgi:hypothetical protein
MPSLHVSIDRTENDGGPELRVHSKEKEMAVDAPKTIELMYYACPKNGPLTSRKMDIVERRLSEFAVLVVRMIRAT